MALSDEQLEYLEYITTNEMSHTQKNREEFAEMYRRDNQDSLKQLQDEQNQMEEGYQKEISEKTQEYREQQSQKENENKNRTR